MKVWVVETAVGTLVAESFLAAVALRNEMKARYGWARLTSERVEAMTA